MFQPDLFAPPLSAPVSDRGVHPPERVFNDPSSCRLEADLDLPAVLERLAQTSQRPRYTFMVLNLIARAAGASDSAGPYVREDGHHVPVRDWLSDALLPMAHRDARRLLIVAQERARLMRAGQLPDAPELAEQVVAEEVKNRLRHSGRTNVSRAVSDLVRAGLIRRHYQGYRVDHVNRGAQREAVYTIAPAVRRALGKAG